MTSALMLRASVRGLMKAEGRPMTVRHPVTGTYDPATGVATSTTYVDYTGWGRLGNYSNSVVDGTLIQSEDRRVTLVLDDASYTPDIDDLLLVGNVSPVQYDIVNNKPRVLGDQIISHTLQVRA